MKHLAGGVGLVLLLVSLAAIPACDSSSSGGGTAGVYSLASLAGQWIFRLNCPIQIVQGKEMGQGQQALLVNSGEEQGLSIVYAGLAQNKVGAMIFDSLGRCRTMSQTTCPVAATCGLEFEVFSNGQVWGKGRYACPSLGGATTARLNGAFINVNYIVGTIALGATKCNFSLTKVIQPST